VVGGLHEFAVAHDLSPEILVEGVEHAFPVVAAVVLAPPAAEGVSRRVLGRLGEEALEAVEVARRHFLGGFHVRPETCQVEAFQDVLSFLLRRRCGYVALNCGG